MKVTPLLCTLIVLFSGCATQPKRECYEFTLNLGGEPKTQTICSDKPLQISIDMRKVP